MKTQASWWRRSLHSGMAVCVLLAGLWVVDPVAAQENLLSNSGFEEGFHVQGAAQEVSVANGWTAWWVQGSRQQTNQGYLVRPEYKAEDGNLFGYRRVHSGQFAQKFFNSFSTHDSGLFQVIDVTAGINLQFTAWVQTWSTGSDDPEQVVEPGDYQVSVGIDPTGGTNPLASSVIWSEPQFSNNSWTQLMVAAQAQSDQVTVFTRGAPQYRVKHNDSYWDDLSLIQIEALPEPTPVAPPEAQPTPPEEVPDSYVVQPGDNLFRISLRYGTTVQALMDLNGLQNPNTIWVGQQLVLRGSGAGAGEAAPPPGGGTSTYTVEPGDSLGEIALMFNTTTAALISLNNIVNPDLVYAGQVLTVPGSAAPAPVQPRTHVVQPGEMLSSIASYYGVSMWAIAEANNLTNINYIWVGQRLVIPAF